MPVICDQNDEALKPKWQKEILGWLQNDEPDNAQALPNKAGYGPPILPAKVLERYHQMKKADPPPTDRPVILNLGQGVAWDGWYGRGTRTNKPEDYPEYVKAGDIVSFDIYPVVHDSKEVAGKLWYVARGVERLVKWTNETEAANGGAAKLGGTGKPVWACIECTHIANAKIKPTPNQVRSEVWMALIEGASRPRLFRPPVRPQVHRGRPAQRSCNVAVRLPDQPRDSVLRSHPSQPPHRQARNRRIGPARQSASPRPRIPHRPPHPSIRRRHHVFAVSLRETPVKATISFAGAAGDIEVLAEKRTLPAAAYQWTDDFAPPTRFTFTRSPRRRPARGEDRSYLIGHWSLVIRR